MFKSLLPALGLLALASTAEAHVTLETAEAAAGSTYRAVFRVPHGCNGEATHTVRIDIPEGFYAVKPMPKAPWTLETTTGAYRTPYMNHGAEMTEGVRRVIWSGGHLEDSWYDEFVLRGSIGPDVAPGTVLHFPVTQICANGTAEWTDTSGEGGSPAPKLTVTASQPAGQSDHDHAAHGDGHAAMEAPVTLGDLTIEGAFSRATLPNAPVAGGFMTIRNAGREADRLVGASSAIAGRAEIHEMAMEGDVMKMRELPDGLEIPAGGAVELKPGGYHVMLMELKGPLVEGETVEVELSFEKAGTVTVPLTIGAPNAKGGGHEGHGSHSDHGDH